MNPYVSYFRIPVSNLFQEKNNFEGIPGRSGIDDFGNELNGLRCIVIYRFNKIYLLFMKRSRYITKFDTNRDDEASLLNRIQSIYLLELQVAKLNVRVCQVTNSL